MPEAERGGQPRLGGFVLRFYFPTVARDPFRAPASLDLRKPKAKSDSDEAFSP